MRRVSVIAATVVWSLLAPSLRAAPKQTVVVIQRPTVVAFFPPVKQADLNDPDTNEALADFQLYAAKVRKPLHDAGIDFKEIYALSFRVQRGTRTTTFRSGKDSVGYYLVAPSKEPRIEYGVMTDTDLLQIAAEYFGLAAK
jgi:hypothetical protein